MTTAAPPSYRHAHYLFISPLSPLLLALALLREVQPHARSLARSHVVIVIIIVVVVVSGAFSTWLSLAVRKTLFDSGQGGGTLPLNLPLLDVRFWHPF